MMSRIVLVTEANRRLGLETNRQLIQRGYHVILTWRRLNRVQSIVKALHAAALSNTFAAQLNVTDDRQVHVRVRHVLQCHERIDVLVTMPARPLPAAFAGTAGAGCDAQIAVGCLRHQQCWCLQACCRT